MGRKPRALLWLNWREVRGVFGVSGGLMALALVLATLSVIHAKQASTYDDLSGFWAVFMATIGALGYVLGAGFNLRARDLREPLTSGIATLPVSSAALWFAHMGVRAAGAAVVGEALGFCVFLAGDSLLDGEVLWVAPLLTILGYAAIQTLAWVAFPLNPWSAIVLGVCGVPAFLLFTSIAIDEAAWVIDAAARLRLAAVLGIPLLVCLGACLAGLRELRRGRLRPLSLPWRFRAEGQAPRFASAAGAHYWLLRGPWPYAYALTFACVGLVSFTGTWFGPGAAPSWAARWDIMGVRTLFFALLHGLFASTLVSGFALVRRHLRGNAEGAWLVTRPVTTRALALRTLEVELRKTASSGAVAAAILLAAAGSSGQMEAVVDLLRGPRANAGGDLAGIPLLGMAPVGALALAGANLLLASWACMWPFWALLLYLGTIAGGLAWGVSVHEESLILPAVAVLLAPLTAACWALALRKRLLGRRELAWAAVLLPAVVGCMACCDAVYHGLTLWRADFGAAARVVALTLAVYAPVAVWPLVYDRLRHR